MHKKGNTRTISKHWHCQSLEGFSRNAESLAGRRMESDDEGPSVPARLTFVWLVTAGMH